MALTTNEAPSRASPLANTLAPSSVTRGANQAPKLWPALPVRCTRMCPSGRPAAPRRRATSYDSRPPTAWSTFCLIADRRRSPDASGV